MSECPALYAHETGLTVRSDAINPGFHGVRTGSRHAGHGTGGASGTEVRFPGARRRTATSKLSGRALEWAMKEAVIRHAPLTVLTVHEAVAGYFGGVASYPDDEARTERAREAAQTETDKVLAELGASMAGGLSR